MELVHLYHSPSLLPFAESIPGTTFTLRGINLVESAYAVWLGQPVVLQVSAGDLTVPLRGTIIGESSAAVRFRVGEGWDVDIYKAMILAVEEDNWASVIT